MCELNLSLYLKLFGKALCVSADYKFKFSLLYVMGKVYFFTNLEILLIALPVGPVSFCGSITLDSLIEKETNTQVPYITLVLKKTVCMLFERVDGCIVSVNKSPLPGRMGCLTLTSLVLPGRMWCLDTDVLRCLGSFSKEALLSF